MKKALSSTILILSIILPGFSFAQEPLVVFLVRHADRVYVRNADGKVVGKKDRLTLLGVERAAVLAEKLSDERIQHIHSTGSNRTRRTAAEFGLNLKIYISGTNKGLKDLITKIRNDGGRHLVVGHSESLLQVVTLLGGIPGPDMIDQYNEFDRLYKVTIRSDGTTCSEMQRYGTQYSPEQNVVMIKSIGETCYGMERYGEL